MTPESKLWSAIGRKVEGDTCRVENSTGSGMPDVNTCRKGIEVWIELKVMTGNQFSLRHAQMNWARKRIRDGQGRIVVLVGKKEKLGWDLYLYGMDKLLVTEPSREDAKRVYFNYAHCFHEHLSARNYDEDELNKCVYNS